MHALALAHRLLLGPPLLLQLQLQKGLQVPTRGGDGVMERECCVAGSEGACACRVRRGVRVFTWPRKQGDTTRTREEREVERKGCMWRWCDWGLGVCYSA